MKRFYLDYNATTPLHPNVKEAMLPYLETHFGNPSSIHQEGRMARAAIDQARDKMAYLLGAKPHEIIFTGSGTEANNLALFGLAFAQEKQGKHLITSQTEHHAVLHVFERLEKKFGFSVTYLPVDQLGLVSESDLARAITSETTLVSIMSANNETGTRQEIEKIASFCRERSILFHTDAIQSWGKEKVSASWVDALSLAAHKFYGPKGVGVLFLRSGLALDPLFVGGAQENQRRPGTENVAGIVGLVAAAELVLNQQDREERLRQFQWIEKFWTAFSRAIPGLHRNGHPTQRIANTLNVSVEGIKGEELLMACDLEGLSLSTGSACMVGSLQASHVLLAMGIPPKVAQATLRFSIGPGIMEESITEIIERLKSIIQHLRSH